MVPPMARYVVKDTSTGKRYKGLNLAQASNKAKLDAGDAGWAIGEHGRADTDTHTIRRQSGRIKKQEKSDYGSYDPGFAFR